MRTQCPHCEARFEAPEGVAGKKARCTNCNQLFIITSCNDVFQDKMPSSKTVAEETKKLAIEEKYRKWVLGQQITYIISVLCFLVAAVLHVLIKESLILNFLIVIIIVGIVTYLLLLIPIDFLRKQIREFELAKYPQEQRKEINTTYQLARLSLILGIPSVFIIFLSIPGLIVSLIALRRFRRNADELEGRGLAIAGIISSSIGVLVLLSVILILIIHLL